MKPTTEIERIEKQLMLDRVHLILTEPESFQALKLLMDDVRREKAKIVAAKERWLYKLLKRRLSDSMRGAVHHQRVQGQVSRREALRRFREGLYEEGREKFLEKFLRSQFEKNKRHGLVKTGEWKLTEDDLRKLFNYPVYFWGKTRKLREIGNEVFLKRIDSSGDVELSNLRVYLRLRRKRMGVYDKYTQVRYVKDTGRKTRKYKNRVILDCSNVDWEEVVS